jgi:TonB family protein
MKLIVHILFIFLLLSISYAINAQSKTAVFKVRKHQNAKVIKKYSVMIATSDGVAFSPVDINASFQGGNVNDFINWVKSRITYPNSAKGAKISGKVNVQFSVNFKGKVVEAKIIRGISKDIDNEVLRVISSSPAWIPANQDGMAVKQEFAISVVFKSK